MNMNSHFKKIRKGNTGKIGVWDIKKEKQKMKFVREFYKKSKMLEDGQQCNTTNTLTYNTNRYSNWISH